MKKIAFDKVVEHDKALTMGNQILEFDLNMYIKCLNKPLANQNFAHMISIFSTTHHIASHRYANTKY